MIPRFILTRKYYIDIHLLLILRPMSFIIILMTIISRFLLSITNFCLLFTIPIRSVGKVGPKLLMYNGQNTTHYYGQVSG